MARTETTHDSVELSHEDRGCAETETGSNPGARGAVIPPQRDDALRQLWPQVPSPPQRRAGAQSARALAGLR